MIYITAQGVILVQHSGNMHTSEPVSAQEAHGKLGPDLWQALHSVLSMRVYPNGATLFQQGTVVDGVYLIESGQVRLLIPTVQSRLQLLELAGPGAILGLSETMTGVSFRITAEAADCTTVAFIERENFLAFLRDHGDFCMQVVRLLSEDLHVLYHKFRNISAHPGRPRQRPPDEQLN